MSKMSRRTFLWLTGGSSFALATNPPRKLVNKLIPQVIPPEEIRPGMWVQYATTCRECPAGCGMHLSHRDGRVTKAEGNPVHPVNQGGLCPRGQSSLQGLYDPDRLKQVLYRMKGERDRKQSWEQAITAISARLKAGGRVAVLSSLQTGSLAEVMQAFAAAFGSDRVLFYEPFDYEPIKAAHQQLHDRPVVPTYRLDASDFILSFAADFLETWVSPVSFAVQFAKMRSYQGGGRVNRFAYVGPRFSMTAANADDYLQVPPGYERVVAAALLKTILDRGWQKNGISAARGEIDALLSGVTAIPGVSPQALESLARAFTSARAPVALAGAMGGAGPVATDTAILAALLNEAAGSTAVDLSAPHAVSDTARPAQLQAFFASLGPEDTLFIHDTNPLYSRPWTAPHLARAGMVVYLGTMVDETAERAHWLLPVDYPLESWGDYEPSPGIHSLMQPTMGRLYASRGAGDVFLALARAAGKPLSRGSTQPEDFKGWLRQRWDSLGGTSGGIGGELFWNTALQNGGVWKGSTGSAAPSRAGAGAVKLSGVPVTAPAVKAGVVELWPWASIMMYDGRVANRGWLQEAPDPVTFMVWGNWIDLHPRTAAALELEDGDVAELKSTAGIVRAPVRVSDDISEQTAAISFGQGHSALGSIARGIGANAFALLNMPQDASTFGTCRIRRVRRRGEDLLVQTAPTREQHEREIVQWIRLSELQKMRPGEGDDLVLPLPEGYRPDKDLYPKRDYTKHRWAMVIDLHRCIGCGACSVACYAENNIAVVGKDKMFEGQREMAWLRVAPYRKPDSPRRISWLPLLCQHCDAAPCEPVCPVFAAMHNEEGLNAQIYNRCIGTRYCSNNCPYKVRRFNWINIKWIKPLDLQLNPEVTVRTRGVMEKCTFCVQRIRQAEYRAVRERRKIRDGEIQPACAQSCPTRVYTFGDLLDPNSEVSRLTRSDPRRYHLLEDLNTKPAVTFLRKIDIDTA